MRVLISAALIAALAGCATEDTQRFQQKFRSLFPSNRGESALADGVRLYEDGEYGQSGKSLQGALDQGLGRKDQAKAHKYLAFIHCSSGRERQCRDEFHKALAAEPSMELAPAEAGHPVWGPIFRSLKAGR